MVELRGLVVRREGVDKIVEAIVRVEYPDIYEHHGLFRNKPINKGQVRKALAEIYDVKPSDIVWPGHIRISESQGGKDNEGDL